MRLRSINTAEPVAVLFLNACPRPVQVLWLDYAGNEVRLQAASTPRVCGATQTLPNDLRATLAGILREARAGCHHGHAANL